MAAAQRINAAILLGVGLSLKDVIARLTPREHTPILLVAAHTASRRRRRARGVKISISYDGSF